MVSKKSDNSKEVWRSLAVFGSLSLNLGIMVMGGFFLGRLLEERFHLPNMRFTGVLAGLILGLYEMFAIALRYTRKK